MKKTQITRFSPHIEKVNEKGAIELCQYIRQAIDAIYEKNVSQYRYEVLHRSVYKLITNRHGDILYDGVTRSITSHVCSWLDKLTSVSMQQFLPQVTVMWADHVMMTSRIREILLYSEKNFQQCNRTPVYDLGLMIFRDNLITAGSVQPKLTQELLRNVAQERNGYTIDRDCIRTALRMLLELGIHGVNLYEELFERLYLEETKTFYQTEIQSFLAENTCSSCLRKIEGRLQQEARNSQYYLPISTERKLKSIIETVLIENTASYLVGMEKSGVNFMLQEDKRDDLRLIFSVFCRVPSTLDYLRDCFSSYINVIGTSIISDVTSTKDHIRFVQEVLQLRTAMASVVAECFANESKFQNKLKQSFDDFLNKDSSLTASYLALYADDQLKSGFRNQSDSEIEASIDGVVALLSHIQDKDIFESYYKSYLTKRLMGAKSVSEEIEKMVISKLKSEYGYQFTSKLERMFSDMNISRSTMSEFQLKVLNTPEYKSEIGLDCDFTMLTAGYWPAQQHDDSSLPLPPTMERCRDRYIQFYSERHNARRISWQYSLGSVDLRMCIANGKVRHDLNVSLYQTLILMMFNDKDENSYGDISATLPIPELELKRHLLSLCNPKIRILNKESPGKGIQGNSDTFSINDKFTSKFRRIKLPLMTVASIKGNPAGNLQGRAVSDSSTEGGVPAQVLEDRKYAMDSALVRIMKARKSLSHNELIAEVTRQLSGRFTANPQVLKMRIESLIERDYLVRDRDTPYVYNYIA